MPKTETSQVVDLTHELIDLNTRQALIDGILKDYVSASPKYIDQFLWDTCFMAIALSHFKPELAQDQIDLMLLRQRADGFVPIINFYEKMGLAKRAFYSLYHDGQIPLITQPPVLAIAQERIFAVTGNHESLLNNLPKLAQNIDYFMTNRDPDHDGLAAVIHPWELGIDLTASGDRYLRFKSKHPSFVAAYIKMFGIFKKYHQLNWQEDKILASNHYHLENVLFNVILSQASRSVGNLYQSLGDEPNSIRYLNIAATIKQAILDRCWNDKDQTFYDLDHDNHQIPVASIASLSPLFLDDLDPYYSRGLVNQLLDPNKFWSPYPIPSISMDEPTFNHKNTRVLWRGQTFVNTNWLIYQGLLKNNYPDVAADLAQKTINMVVQNRPYEFFNPLTGKGGGMTNLGWDSLILDLI